MVKSRTTVNDLRIYYNEETDEITFEKNDIALTLKMGEDELNLLYHMTPYVRYKDFLLKKQNFRCADCGKNLEELPAREYALHHDPSLGIKGARYIDFKGLTRNRMLCKDCHGELRKRIVCRRCGEVVVRDRRKHLKDRHPEIAGDLTMEELLGIYREHFDFRKNQEH